MLGLQNLRDEDLKWWQRSARAKGVRSIDAVPTRVLQCSSKEQCGGCTADYFITLEQRTVQSGRGELRLDLIHHITGKPGVKTTFPRKSRVVSSNNLALCKSSPGRYIKSKNPFKARTYNFFELSTYLLWRTTFKAMFYPLRLFWTKLIFNMIFFLKKLFFSQDNWIIPFEEPKSPSGIITFSTVNPTNGICQPCTLLPNSSSKYIVHC